MKTKIVICGASGFIGRNIAEKLAERTELEVFGTYFKNKPTRISKKIKLIQADLTKIKDVDKVVAGRDIIIQAAAVTSGSKDIVAKPYMHVTDNAVINSLIFRAAFENKLKHVVFFSCTVMYPSQDILVKEKDFNYQITDKYFGVGWTKVYLEKMCEFFSKISNTKYTAIRHSNMYGPFDKYDLEHSHVFGATVTKIMTNIDGKINVWGDGSEKRDLLYISDLVDFVETVIKKQKERFELINLGMGESVSVKDLINKIIKISGKNLVLKFDTSKPTIKFSLAVNIDKAKMKYNWKPKVSLDEGIRKTLTWYKRNIL